MPVCQEMNQQKLPAMAFATNQKSLAPLLAALVQWAPWVATSVDSISHAHLAHLRKYPAKTCFVVVSAVPQNDSTE